MSEHVSEDLPRLLTGDATRDEVMSAADHLRGCPDCQQDLISTVVAHASLASAHRFAPEVVQPATMDETETEDSPGATSSAPVLPDLSAVFAQARTDAEQESATAAIGRHRGLVRTSQRRLMAVGAAAAIVVGGGVTAAVVELHDGNPSGQTVALTAFPGNTPASTGAQATMRLNGTSVQVDGTKLPKIGSTHVYEVWLTNDTGEPSAIGTMDSNSTAHFTVARKTLNAFDKMVVSVQPADQTTKYSKVSVVRGQYR